MTYSIPIQPGEKLALRNPESTALGRKIVRQGLLLMQQIGYEHFTFKKLAEHIQTTEAGIYRYFENKHRLLLYLLTWYWNVLDYAVEISLEGVKDPTHKIRLVIGLLTQDLSAWTTGTDVDGRALRELAMAESSKAYLIKEVDDINRERLFKPYKDLCGRLAGLLLEYNPEYLYPRSLASSLVEMAQFQPYFAAHLPALTDFGGQQQPDRVAAFLENLVFAALEKG
jgi:AcrR family transcriptional regulator